MSLQHDELEPAADLFQALSSPSRLQILRSLSNGEKCVHELTEELDMTHSNISHHLKKLKDNRIVERRKEGKHRYYSMDDDHITTLIETGVAHTDE
ncbi:MAG: metalloregulator ArsR/SmtB family transcription factor [Candidatus Nanohaloarchaea archaeon]|nr:metalloregulator ArsR/SmtB family transcription factor [Candidatus Nanohaloarchaea archaeon]